MKDLFNINESEKNRILGLHESVSTKKVNLSENWWEEELPKDKWQVLEMDIRKSMDKIIRYSFFIVLNYSYWHKKSLNILLTIINGYQ